MPLVMKFGGSSVADADRLRRVADLVRSSMGQTPLVVLSATGGTTNTLVAASHAAADVLASALVVLARSAGCGRVDAGGHAARAIDIGRGADGGDEGAR